MIARHSYIRTLQVMIGYGLSEMMLHISHTWPLFGHVA